MTSYPLEFTIKGEIPSMKNSARIGRGGQFYHADNCVKAYKGEFYRQLPAKYKGLKLKEAVKVSLVVYLKDHRKDGHNLHAVVYDALQYAGVIENDRQIVAGEWRTEFDKDNPRVFIKVEKLDDAR